MAVALCGDWEPMRHNRKSGLHLIAAGSVIALVTMVSVLPAAASSTPKPGPAGLLPALHKVKAAGTRSRTSLTTQMPSVTGTRFGQTQAGVPAWWPGG